MVVEGGKQQQGFMVIDLSQNPITQIQNKLKDLGGGFKEWVGKQSVAVETTVVTATGAIQGAAIGGIMGTLTKDSSATTLLPPPHPSLSSLHQAQALTGGPLIQARNFAVMTSVNAGIACVMKIIRGKEDVQSRAFGSGAMFSLVSGMGGPNQAANMVTSGLFFAIVQGGLFKFGEKFSQPSVEDVCYKKTSSLLANLGLQCYEKNFRKGLLTDVTLPLLNDSALRDARIPPGPRLLILDHI